MRKGEYEYISLTKYTLEGLSNPSYTIRSVSLTGHTISIAFSKETVEMEPAGAIGIDRNLDNITTADSEGNVRRFDLSRVSEIKAKCRETKSHFKRNDVRIRGRIFEKYGTIQRNRVQWILHNTSSSIIRQAKERRQAIIMENIKGIRKLYRRGNGQGNVYRARLNSWSFYELQRQIEYKAKWEGIPVDYLDARGTSAMCAKCGCKTMQNPNAHRLLYCPNCRISMDRDVNAARNILAKGGVRFTPSGLASEAVNGNE